MYAGSNTSRPRIFDIIFTLFIGLCLALSVANHLFDWLERSSILQLILLVCLAPLLGWSYYWIWQTNLHKVRHGLVIGGFAVLLILGYFLLHQNPPLFSLPYRSGSLEIIATGKKDSLAEGKEIQILGLQIDQQTIPLNQLNRQGGWLEEDQHLIHRKGGKATLSYTLPHTAKNIQITFASGPQAGRGIVQINGMETRFDLYKETTDTSVQSYPAALTPPLLAALLLICTDFGSILLLLPSVMLLLTTLRSHRKELDGKSPLEGYLSESGTTRFHPYTYVWQQICAEKRDISKLVHAIINSLKASIGIWGFVVASMAGIVTLLWLPYGFDRGPALDIWRVMTLGGNLYYQSSPPATLLDLVTTRFVPMWQWLLGNMLTPESFVGYNLLLAGTIALLGVVFFGVIKTLLPGYQGLAFLAAVLAILNSTDDWYFTIENVHIEILILEFFLAVYLLLIYWRYPSRLLFLFIIALQISIAGNYDSFYPLFLAVPLLLLWQDRRITRRWIITSLLWCLFPLIRFAGFVYATFIAKTHYASSMVNDSIPLQTALGSRFFDSLAFVYKMTLGFGYQEGLKQVVETFRGGVPPLHLILSLVIALGAAAAYWFAFRKQSPEQPLQPRRWMVWLTGSFLFIYFGYMMYFPSPLGLINYRSLLIACPLAAILITGLVWIIDSFLKTKTIFFTIIMSVLIGLSALYSYENIRNTFNASVEQVNYVKLIAAQAPQVEDETVILIYTDPQNLSNIMLQGFFPNTVDLIYDNPTLQAMWTDENGNTTFGKLQDMFGHAFNLEQCILLKYTQSKITPKYGYVRSPGDPRVIRPLYIQGKMERLDTFPPNLLPDGIDGKQYLPKKRISGKQLPQRLESMFHYAQHGYQ